MSRMNGAVGAAVLAAALPLSGCAAMFGGYDLAPSGLPADEDALRRELAYEPDRAYSSVLQGSRDIPEDDLLRLLYAGMAGRYAGAYAESCHLLDLASYLAEDRVTVRVSQQVMSMVTSDRALAYTPSRTERLMIHYSAAVGFLEAGDYDAAAVEARRLEALLDRLGETGDGTSVSSDARFFHLFDAAVFEAARYPDAAEVAYRRAGATAAPGADSAGETGEVLVLVEHGFVPHRVEQSVVVLVPGWQVSRLADGDAAEKAAAAAEAAARILVVAGTDGRSGYYHDHGWRGEPRLDPWDCRHGCPAGDDDADTDPYLLRISWPVLYRDAPEGGAVRVRAAGAARAGGAPTTSAEPPEPQRGVNARFDVADGVRRDFDGERAAIIARTVARAASKLALTAGAKSAVREKDEAAGRVVGWLANLGTALTERADTRSWHLLPGSVSLVRLRLPPGAHDLELEVEGGLPVPLGSVDVRAGRTTVVTHRVWR